MIVLKIIGFVLLGIIALLIIALSLRVRLNVEYSTENTSVVLQYLFLKIPIFPKSEKKDNGEDSKKKKAEKVKKNESKKKKEPETVLAEKPAEISVSVEPEEDGPHSVNTAEAENPLSSAAPEGVSDAVETEQPVSQPAEKTPGKKKSNIADLLKTLYNAEGIDGLMLIAKRSVSYLGTFFGGLLRGIVVDDFCLDVRCTKSDAASTAVYYGEVCSTLFPLLASLAAKSRVKHYDVNVYPDYIARFSSASFIIDFYFIPNVMIGHVLALGVKFLFKVILQIAIKIILFLKGKKTTGNDKNNLKEKSGVTNE